MYFNESKYTFGWSVERGEYYIRDQKGLIVAAIEHDYEYITGYFYPTGSHARGKCVEEMKEWIECQTMNYGIRFVDPKLKTMI